MIKRKDSKNRYYFVDSNKNKLRCACVILKFRNHFLTIDDQNVKKLEFPGGTVEKPDLCISDTAIREFIEEVILHNRFSGKYCRKWRTFHYFSYRLKNYMSYIIKQIRSKRYFVFGNGDLKNAYFVININRIMFNYFKQKFNMISLNSIDIFNKIIKSKKNTSKFVRNFSSYECRRRLYLCLKNNFHKLIMI